MGSMFKSLTSDKTSIFVYEIFSKQKYFTLMTQNTQSVSSTHIKILQL